jgi:desulfoferrodoxin (superoxide reductase-like protein)
MKLDFSINSKIKIVHPDSSSFEMVGVVKYKSEDHYSVKMKSRKNDKEALYALGNWMIDAALRGELKQFSYSNINPEYVYIDKLKICEDYEIFSELKKKLISIEEMKNEKEIEKNIEKNVEEEINEKKENEKKEIKIKIGNIAIKDNKNPKFYNWKVFVESDKNIKEVKFQLHETFNPNQIIVKNSPFEISRSGWGTFNILIDVKFHDGSEKNFEHFLTFNDSNEKFYNL